MEVDLKKIREALGLLNCMVRCGEQHTSKSESVVSEALEELGKLERQFEK